MKYGNLELGDNQIWFSRGRSKVSYPESGNETCFEVEDQSFWFRHRNDCILECMRNYPPPGSVFDIGGGNGFVSIGIQQAGFDAILVEPGIAGAQNAHRRGLTDVICSTLEDAGFESHSLPAVGIFDVLEHIEKDQGFLGQLHQAMRRDGRLYVTVPAYRWLWSVDDDFSGHARRYTRSRLVRDIEQAGFEVEYSTYFFAALPIPIFLTRTLPGRLSIRDTANSEGGAREHVPQQRIAAPLRAIFEWERRSVASKRRIPFGSSVLLVAKPISERCAQ